MTIHDQLLTFAVVALVFYFILQKGLHKKILVFSILMGVISCIGQLIENGGVPACVMDGAISAMVWYSMVAGVRMLFSEKGISLSPSQTHGSSGVERNIKT